MGALGNMVRIAVLDSNNTIEIVYELSHFVSLGLHENESIAWEIDKEGVAFEGGSWESGLFYPPPPCEDCMSGHE